MKRLLLIGIICLITYPAFAGFNALVNSVGNPGTVVMSQDVTCTNSGVCTLGAIDATPVSAPTGSGSVVLATSPHFTSTVGIGTAAYLPIGTSDLIIYGASSPGSFIIGQQSSNDNAIWLGVGTAAPSNSNFVLSSGAGLGDTNVNFNIPNTGGKLYFSYLNTRIGVMTSSGGLSIGTTSSGASVFNVVGLGTTSPGTGGGYMCVDSIGATYVKASCP